MWKESSYQKYGSVLLDEPGKEGEKDGGIGLLEMHESISCFK